VSCNNISARIITFLIRRCQCQKFVVPLIFEGESRNPRGKTRELTEMNDFLCGFGGGVTILFCLMVTR